MTRTDAIPAVVLTLALALFAVAAPARASTFDDMLQTDMTLPHEVLPHGVPTYWNWAQHPFVSPPAPAGYTAFTAWGHVYRCADDAYDPDDYVQIADVQTWMLDDTGWHEHQIGVRLDGAAFPEDYSRSQIAPNYQSRGETWVNVRQVNGYNFHFWPRYRSSFGPTVRKIIVLARARLFGQGERNGCVGLSMGGDYWLDAKALYPNVTGAVVGRFKRVDASWRVFSATIDIQPSGIWPYPFSFDDTELR